MDDVYDFPSRPVPVELAELKVKRDGGGCARVVDERVEGVGRVESTLGWQARNEQVTRSVRFESDWVGLGLVTHSDAGDARESAEARAPGVPGCVDGCRKERAQGGWERVGGG